MEIEKIDNIDRVIASCLAEKATDEEYAILNKWIKSSKENYKYFHQIQNIWDTLNPDNRISDEFTLAALKKVEGRISGEERKKGFLFYLQRIAAVAIIPLIIGAYFFGNRNQSNNAQVSEVEVYNEIKAAYGTRSSLQLSDGSLVWLNSGSSLKYPVKFLNTERKVFLSGEAYFEVHSDKKTPFVVQTSKLDVRATGTKFNVQAFTSSTITEVALLEGKVDIIKKVKNSKLSQLQEMNPNQYLTYDSISGQIKLINEDVYKYLAWKDGKLIFRNESLPQVVKKLCLVYNVEIELRGKQLQEFRYWGTFKEESLANILKFLKVSSPIDYKEIDIKPAKDGTFPKKKYVIFQASK